MAPYSQEKVSSALKESLFFEICSDASNIGNIKTYPYAVQYFSIKNVIRRQILDFYEDPNETSTDIFKNIKRITIENKQDLQKILHTAPIMQL